MYYCYDNLFSRIRFKLIDNRQTIFKKRFKVALGCMVIRTQCELMIRRVQFIRRTKEAATQAACAGNTRGYHSGYGNSWFNNRENDDAIICFDHITTATTPLPNRSRMKRTSYNNKVIYT